MSSAPLSADDLCRRVAGTVGRLDAGALTQPLMRPERGCMSLVSVRSFFFLVSDCPWFSQSGFLSVFRSWGVTSLPCHRSWRTRWTEPRGGSLRRRRRRRRTRKRLGLASGCGLGTPWRGVVGGRIGTGSRGSRRQTPDDDDDDDDDEDDDMAARLGLSPNLRLGQGSSSQPPSGLASSVSGAGTSGSRSEEQG
jgi:hypothetical protein